MSLVAYGSSDESENEDEINEQPVTQIKSSEIVVESVNKINKVENNSAGDNGQNVNKNNKLLLPSPKPDVSDLNSDSIIDSDEEIPNFDVIPKPKTIDLDNKINVEETDKAPVPRKVDYDVIEKPPKKEKGRAKISIPSLSDFKDLDEEDKQIHTKVVSSKKGSGLIGMLPPPKVSASTIKTSSMVPYVLTKKPVEISKSIEKAKAAVEKTMKKIQKASAAQGKSKISTLNSISGYNSDSDDEDSSPKMDFFSLSTPTKVPDEFPVDVDITDIEKSLNNSDELKETNKTLVSNVMNLPKEEILMKNKAEVGPKLPIPEQEYNVDSDGNVAFDEKAIEYLCGKRGIKRRNEFNNIDIVEINGEDIKPDEREWLVKALTEEPIQRPISVGAGPSGLSKKKHQITYLAHQAKAMELELKNQWAQNKASRQQTRSKYGF